MLESTAKRHRAPKPSLFPALLDQSINAAEIDPRGACIEQLLPTEHASVAASAATRQKELAAKKYLRADCFMIGDFPVRCSNRRLDRRSGRAG
jgi:hypothetical protein